MNFEETLQYLLSLGHETLAIKLGLRNTELLLERLGNPQKSFASVQFAGTNGKGSSAVTLDSICNAAGIHTGLFTSPHLVSITERIRIGGREISQEKFALYASKVRAAAGSLLAEDRLETLPTFFEQVTAIALLGFREAGVRLAILETGLGGRLDATTVAGAETVAITPLALDHQEYLGETLEEIASEKAAIIRPGVTAIIAEQPPPALDVILQRCAEVKVEPSVELDQSRNRIEQVSEDGRLVVTFETNEARYDNVPLGLRGRHQVVNTSVAIRLAEALRKKGFEISKAAIIGGIKTASHDGRLELHDGQPSWLFDGAHNPAGARALRNFLDEFVKRPITLVFGAMNDKRLEEIASILFPAADRLVLTRPNNLRAAEVGTLGSLAARIVDPEKTTIAASVSEALRQAKDITSPNGLICVTGSLYLLGEVKAIMNTALTKNGVLSSESLAWPYRSHRSYRTQHLFSESLSEVTLMASSVGPQILESKEIFRGRIFDVTVDTICEGDTTYQREVVHHPGSTVIIPVFGDGSIALVRQYRHPAGRYLLEAPAGTLNRGEVPEEGAARELEEELGWVAGHLEKLSEFFVSPGFCEEKMWVYLATDLTETKQRLEDDEILEVVRIPFSQALGMITTGEIEDAKTIIGVMLAAPRVGPAMLEANYPAV